MNRLWGKFQNGKVWHALIVNSIFGYMGMVCLTGGGEWPLTVYQSVSAQDRCKTCSKKLGL